MGHQTDIEYSTCSELKLDGSKRLAPIDQDLQAIRSIIDLDSNENAVGHAVPAQSEMRLTMRDVKVMSSKRSHQKTSLARRISGAAKSFIRRPDAPRLLAMFSLLIFAFLEPGFVMFLFVMSLLAGLILYFSLGPDRIEAWVVNRYKRLRERDPYAAERVRLRCAKASKKLSVIIEKLPQRWTTGLYLPDFEEPAKHPEKCKTDPFDRLARQSR